VIRRQWAIVGALAIAGAWMRGAAAMPADEAFAAGRAALADAQAAAQAARQALLDASRVRQALIARRGQPTTGGDPAAELERLQQAGAEQRSRGDAALQQAQQHFTAGMVTGWPRWVRNTEPLTLDEALRRHVGHNAVVRSVHPNMPPLPAAGAASAADAGFTLQFPMLASQNPPPDLDIGAFQLSRGQRYVAHIEVHVDDDTAAANAAGVPLNRLHRWRLLLSDLHGAPVTGARIEVAGHMPGHVHGLPTQPRVTRMLAPGVYLVEGLKFQMEGWWVMQFEIVPPGPGAEPDNVAFNLVFE
jgi:hypothetical protein